MPLVILASWSQTFVKLSICLFFLLNNSLEQPAETPNSYTGLLLNLLSNVVRETESQEKMASLIKAEPFSLPHSERESLIGEIQSPDSKEERFNCLDEAHVSPMFVPNQRSLRTASHRMKPKTIRKAKRRKNFPNQRRDRTLSKLRKKKSITSERNKTKVESGSQNNSSSKAVLVNAFPLDSFSPKIGPARNCCGLKDSRNFGVSSFQGNAPLKMMRFEENTPEVFEKHYPINKPTRTEAPFYVFKSLNPSNFSNKSMSNGVSIPENRFISGNDRAIFVSSSNLTHTETPSHKFWAVTPFVKPSSNASRISEVSNYPEMYQKQFLIGKAVAGEHVGAGPLYKTFSTESPNRSNASTPNLPESAACRLQVNSTPCWHLNNLIMSNFRKDTNFGQNLTSIGDSKLEKNESSQKQNFDGKNLVFAESAPNSYRNGRNLTSGSGGGSNSGHRETVLAVNLVGIPANKTANLSAQSAIFNHSPSSQFLYNLLASLPKNGKYLIDLGNSSFALPILDKIQNKTPKVDRAFLANISVSFLRESGNKSLERGSLPAGKFSHCSKSPIVPCNFSRSFSNISDTARLGSIEKPKINLPDTRLKPGSHRTTLQDFNSMTQECSGKSSKINEEMDRTSKIDVTPQSPCMYGATCSSIVGAKIQATEEGSLNNTPQTFSQDTVGEPRISSVREETVPPTLNSPSLCTSQTFRSQPTPNYSPIQLQNAEKIAKAKVELLQAIRKLILNKALINDQPSQNLRQNVLEPANEVKTTNMSEQQLMVEGVSSNLCNEETVNTTRELIENTFNAFQVVTKLPFLMSCAQNVNSAIEPSSKFPKQGSGLSNSDSVSKFALKIFLNGRQVYKNMVTSDLSHSKKGNQSMHPLGPEIISPISLISVAPKQKFGSDISSAGKQVYSEGDTNGAPPKQTRKKGKSLIKNVERKMLNIAKRKFHCIRSSRRNKQPSVLSDKLEQSNFSESFFEGEPKIFFSSRSLRSYNDDTDEVVTSELNDLKGSKNPVPNRKKRKLLDLVPHLETGGILLTAKDSASFEPFLFLNQSEPASLDSNFSTNASISPVFSHQNNPKIDSEDEETSPSLDLPHGVLSSDTKNTGGEAFFTNLRPQSDFPIPALSSAQASYDLNVSDHAESLKPNRRKSSFFQAASGTEMKQNQSRIAGFEHSSSNNISDFIIINPGNVDALLTAKNCSKGNFSTENKFSSYENGDASKLRQTALPTVSFQIEILEKGNSTNSSPTDLPKVGSSSGSYQPLTILSLPSTTITNPAFNLTSTGLSNFSLIENCASPLPQQKATIQNDETNSIKNFESGYEVLHQPVLPGFDSNLSSSSNYSRESKVGTFRPEASFECNNSSTQSVSSEPFKKVSPLNSTDNQHLLIYLKLVSPDDNSSQVTNDSSTSLKSPNGTNQVFSVTSLNSSHPKFDTNSVTSKALVASINSTRSLDLNSRNNTENRNSTGRKSDDIRISDNFGNASNDSLLNITFVMPPVVAGSQSNETESEISHLLSNPAFTDAAILTSLNVRSTPFFGANIEANNSAHKRNINPNSSISTIQESKILQLPNSEPVVDTNISAPNFSSQFPKNEFSNHSSDSVKPFTLNFSPTSLNRTQPTVENVFIIKKLFESSNSSPVFTELQLPLVQNVATTNASSFLADLHLDNQTAENMSIIFIQNSTILKIPSLFFKIIDSLHKKSGLTQLDVTGIALSPRLVNGTVLNSTVVKSPRELSNAANFTHQNSQVDASSKNGATLSLNTPSNSNPSPAVSSPQVAQKILFLSKAVSANRENLKNISCKSCALPSSENSFFPLKSLATASSLIDTEIDRKKEEPKLRADIKSKMQFLTPVILLNRSSSTEASLWSDLPSAEKNMSDQTAAPYKSSPTMSLSTAKNSISPATEKLPVFSSDLKLLSSADGKENNSSLQQNHNFECSVRLLFYNDTSLNHHEFHLVSGNKSDGLLFHDSIILLQKNGANTSFVPVIESLKSSASFHRGIQNGSIFSFPSSLIYEAFLNSSVTPSPQLFNTTKNRTEVFSATKSPLLSAILENKQSMSQLTDDIGKFTSNDETQPHSSNLSIAPKSLPHKPDSNSNKILKVNGSPLTPEQKLVSYSTHVTPLVRNNSVSQTIYRYSVGPSNTRMTTNTNLSKSVSTIRGGAAPLKSALVNNSLKPRSGKDNTLLNDVALPDGGKTKAGNHSPGTSEPNKKSSSENLSSVKKSLSCELHPSQLSKSTADGNKVFFSKSSESNTTQNTVSQVVDHQEITSHKITQTINVKFPYAKTERVHGTSFNVLPTVSSSRKRFGPINTMKPVKMTVTSPSQVSYERNLMSKALDSSTSKTFIKPGRTNGMNDPNKLFSGSQSSNFHSRMKVENIGGAELGSFSGAFSLNDVTASHISGLDLVGGNQHSKDLPNDNMIGPTDEESSPVLEVSSSSSEDAGAPPNERLEAVPPPFISEDSDFESYPDLPVIATPATPKDVEFKAQSLTVPEILPVIVQKQFFPNPPIQPNTSPFFNEIIQSNTVLASHTPKTAPSDFPDCPEKPIPVTLLPQQLPGTQLYPAPFDPFKFLTHPPSTATKSHLNLFQTQHSIIANLQSENAYRKSSFGYPRSFTYQNNRRSDDYFTTENPFVSKVYLLYESTASATDSIARECCPTGGQGPSFPSTEMTPIPQNLIPENLDSFHRLPGRNRFRVGPPGELILVPGRRDPASQAGAFTSFHSTRRILSDFVDRDVGKTNILTDEGKSNVSSQAYIRPVIFVFNTCKNNGSSHLNQAMKISDLLRSGDLTAFVTKNETAPSVRPKNDDLPLAPFFTSPSTPNDLSSVDCRNKPYIAPTPTKSQYTTTCSCNHSNFANGKFLYGDIKDLERVLSSVHAKSCPDTVFSHPVTPGQNSSLPALNSTTFWFFNDSQDPSYDCKPKINSTSTTNPLLKLISDGSQKSEIPPPNSSLVANKSHPVNLVFFVNGPNVPATSVSSWLGNSSSPIEIMLGFNGASSNSQTAPNITFVNSPLILPSRIPESNSSPNNSLTHDKCDNTSFYGPVDLSQMSSSQLDFFNALRKNVSQNAYGVSFSQSRSECAHNEGQIYPSQNFSSIKSRSNIGALSPLFYISPISFQNTNAETTNLKQNFEIPTSYPCSSCEPTTIEEPLKDTCLPFNSKPLIRGSSSNGIELNLAKPPPILILRALNSPPQTFLKTVSKLTPESKGESLNTVRSFHENPEVISLPPSLQVVNPVIVLPNSNLDTLAKQGEYAPSVPESAAVNPKKSNKLVKMYQNLHLSKKSDANSKLSGKDDLASITAFKFTSQNQIKVGNDSEQHFAPNKSISSSSKSNFESDREGSQLQSQDSISKTKFLESSQFKTSLSPAPILQGRTYQKSDVIPNREESVPRSNAGHPRKMFTSSFNNTKTEELSTKTVNLDGEKNLAPGSDRLALQVVRNNGSGQFLTPADLKDPPIINSPDRKFSVTVSSRPVVIQVVIQNSSDPAITEQVKHRPSVKFHRGLKSSLRRINSNSWSNHLAPKNVKKKSSIASKYSVSKESEYNGLADSSHELIDSSAELNHKVPIPSSCVGNSADSSPSKADQCLRAPKYLSVSQTRRRKTRVPHAKCPSKAQSFKYRHWYSDRRGFFKRGHFHNLKTTVGHLQRKLQSYEIENIASELSDYSDDNLNLCLTNDKFSCCMNNLSSPQSQNSDESLRHGSFSQKAESGLNPPSSQGLILKEPMVPELVSAFENTSDSSSNGQSLRSIKEELDYFSEMVLNVLSNCQGYSGRKNPKVAKPLNVIPRRNLSKRHFLPALTERESGTPESSPEVKFYYHSNLGLTPPRISLNSAPEQNKLLAPAGFGNSPVGQVNLGSKLVNRNGKTNDKSTFLNSRVRPPYSSGRIMPENKLGSLVFTAQYHAATESHLKIPPQLGAGKQKKDFLSNLSNRYLTPSCHDHFGSTQDKGLDWFVPSNQDLDENLLSTWMRKFLKNSTGFVTNSELSAKDCKLTYHSNCVCDISKVLLDYDAIISDEENSEEAKLSKILDYQCSSYLPLPIGYHIDSESTPRILTRTRKHMVSDNPHGFKEIDEESLYHLLRVRDTSLGTSLLHYAFAGSKIAIPCFDSSKVSLPIGVVDRTRYKWQKGNKVITEGRMRESPEGFLRIENVALTDTGSFLCKVSFVSPEMRNHEHVFNHSLSVVSVPNIAVQALVYYSANAECKSEILEMFDLYMQQLIQESVCDFGEEYRDICVINVYNLLCFKNNTESTMISLNVEMEIKDADYLVINGYTNKTVCSPMCHQKLYLKTSFILRESLHEALLTPIFGRTSFTGEDFTFRLISLDLKMTIGCDAGFHLVENFCVPCPRHSFSTQGSTQCTKCPAGFYQPEIGSRACLRCPSLFTPGCNTVSNIFDIDDKQDKEERMDKTVPPAESRSNTGVSRKLLISILWGVFVAVLVISLILCCYFFRKRQSTKNKKNIPEETAQKPSRKGFQKSKRKRSSPRKRKVVEIVLQGLKRPNLRNSEFGTECCPPEVKKKTYNYVLRGELEEQENDSVQNQLIAGEDKARNSKDRPKLLEAIRSNDSSGNSEYGQPEDFSPPRNLHDDNDKALRRAEKAVQTSERRKKPALPQPDFT